MSKDPDDTRENLVKLIEIARGCENTFDETSMFSGVDSLVSRLSPLGLTISLFSTVVDHWLNE
jgi:hypothetical protein